MQTVTQFVKNNVYILIVLLPVLSFVPAFLILYSLHSWSFEQTYQGRTLLLFFLWLLILESILCWEKLKGKLNKLRSIRTVLFVTTLLLPTVYVVVANYGGLNAMITELANGVISLEDPLRNIHANSLSISAEYMVFAVLSCLMILLGYGLNVLTDFSISISFAGIIGVLFTMDNLYPYGRFTPLQFVVPITATLTANAFNLMGYKTSISDYMHLYYGRMPRLAVWDPENYRRYASFPIAWPCAGIESLLIYTVVILLFMKKTAIPWKQKIAYFAIGAIVTYFINILRITSLFLIAMDYGADSQQWQQFHNYYGMLYSITWIIVYPLIIIVSRVLWEKIKVWKSRPKETIDVSTQIKPF